MRESNSAFRNQLARVLDWAEAHVGFDKAVDGIPPEKRGARAPGFEHSPWQLLEHIRIAQDDILEFCVNDAYQHTMKWPDDYWPKAAAPPSNDAWDESVTAYDPAHRGSHRLPRRPAGRGEKGPGRLVTISGWRAATPGGNFALRGATE